MQAAHRFEHTVDAIADAQKCVLRFEMDVGRPALDRIDQERVDQPHHRLGVFVAANLQALVVDLASLDFVEDAVDRQLVAVELIDKVFELRLARELGLDLDVRAEHGA
ncbi:hypothetical protein D3C83_52010 [compost metagenome]